MRFSCWGRVNSCYFLKSFVFILTNTYLLGLTIFVTAHVTKITEFKGAETGFLLEFIDAV
jgi:hypothetical protein